jgi:hypothetical protein
MLCSKIGKTTIALVGVLRCKWVIIIQMPNIHAIAAKKILCLHRVAQSEWMVLRCEENGHACLLNVTNGR